MTGALHIAFCGGGSGGHVTPAIAIAEAAWKLRPDARLSFFTSDRDIDRTIMHSWLESLGESADNVTVVPLPLTSSRQRLRYLAHVWRSFRQCRRSFRDNPPDVVLGMGGFASVPGVLAARSCGIQRHLFEANRTPGRANRWLRYCSMMAFVGWPWKKRHSWWRTLETGIPLRHRLNKRSTAFAIEQNIFRILILGGSQGAMTLNDLVLRSIDSVASNQSSEFVQQLRIVHQTGLADKVKVAEAWQRAGIVADVQPFLSDVPASLRAADVVISRAGAVTLAEIAAAERASILVPLPSAKDNHQAANAEYFEQAGAAVVIDQNGSGAKRQLADAVQKLFFERGVRSDMETSSHNLYQPHAAGEIARRLILMAGAKKL